MAAQAQVDIESTIQVHIGTGGFRMEMGSEGKQRQASDDSQLFLVRVWLDKAGLPDSHKQSERSEEGDLHGEIRGKIQHILSGKAGNFSDWLSLKLLLSEMIRTHTADQLEQTTKRTRIMEQGNERTW